MAPFTRYRLFAHCGVTGQQGMLSFPIRLTLPLVYPEVRVCLAVIFVGFLGEGL